MLEEIILDSQQEQAVAHVAGPMLVTAGAGTGKTTVLTERIARLINDGHADAENLVAVTFTEKAAAEMSERVAALLSGKPLPRISTFHSFCNGILRENGITFSVLAREELWAFLRKRIAKLPLGYYRKAADPGKFLTDLLRFFDRCLDEMVTPADYSAYVDRVAAGTLPLPRVGALKEHEEFGPQEVVERCREIAAVFACVEQMLAERNLGLYGHMISRAVRLLETDAEALEQLRRRTRFLLVDEFQDCNSAQIKLACLLTENVFAVGDPDQAIYRFRGASTGAFPEFVSRFGAANVRFVFLDANRRSLQPVLNCAHEVIHCNPEPLAGTSVAQYTRAPLRSARQQKNSGLAGIPVTVVMGNAECEANDLARTLLLMRKQGTSWRQFAILSRSHSHREKLLTELPLRGIPILVAGVDVVETAPVRDLLALLRCLDSLSDNIALFRLALMPKFGIPLERLRDLLAAAKGPTSLAAVLESLAQGRALLARLDEGRRLLTPATADVPSLIRGAMRVFSLAPCAELDAMLEFANSWSGKPITETGRLREFLEFIELYRQAGGCITVPVDELAEAVRLMTVHAAKGLEFENVFVIHANSPSFPANHKPPYFDFPNELREAEAHPVAGEDTDFHRQEERRLFYVAMTRAKDRLLLYGKKGSKQEPLPSGFIREMGKTAAPEDYVVREADFRADVAASAPRSPLEQIPVRPELLAAPLSASGIESYETCPFRFRLEHDFKIPGEVAANMQFGSAMHRVLRDHFEARRTGRSIPLEDLLASFRSYMEESRLREDYQAHLFTEQGVRQLREFSGSPLADPFGAVQRVEWDFKVEVAGIKVKGRVDRVDSDGALTLVDYKTGSPKQQEYADKSLQLSIYALAVQKEFGELPGRMLLHNLETNQTVSTSRDTKAFAKAEERVRCAAEGIAAQRFEPTPGHHCGWCGYHSLCPATQRTLSN